MPKKRLEIHVVNESDGGKTAMNIRVSGEACMKDVMNIMLRLGKQFQMGRAEWAVLGVSALEGLDAIGARIVNGASMGIVAPRRDEE